MQALVEDIKKAVNLLGNDSAPDDLQLRACMGITIQLMKDLRNTVVESGSYSELVTSRATQGLAECRTQMALLYRRVPCRPAGCPVTAEEQRYFREVMNNVIVIIDDIIKETLNNRNSRDTNPQNVIWGDSKAARRNLKVFKKLTSKKQSSELSRKTALVPDYMESELQELEQKLERIQKKKEKLKSIQTTLETEFAALRSDGGDAMDINSSKRSNLNGNLRVKMKNSYHSRGQISDCKPKWRQVEGKAKLTTESQKDLRLPSSELSVKSLSEMSTVPMVGSYQNIGNKDLQVSWVQKGHKDFQPKCTPSDFRFEVLKQLESKSSVVVVNSFQNIESQSSLRMENRQDLKPWIQTRSTSLDSIFKHLPHLRSNKSQTTLTTTESLEDLKVLWVRKEKPMVHTSLTTSHLGFMDMHQNDVTLTSFKIDSMPREQTLLFKDLPQFESPTSLTIYSPQDLQVIQIGSTSSNFILKELPESEKDESQTSLTTENPQDLKVLCAQTGSTHSDLVFKNLQEPDVPLVVSIENIQIQRTFSLKSWQDLEKENSSFKLQTSSISSNFGVEDMPQPQKDESQPSLRIKTLENVQVWRSQMDEHMSQTTSNSGDFILKNERELESNMALAGSISNIQINSSLRQDLPVSWFQNDKPSIRPSFTSDFLLRGLLYTITSTEDLSVEERNSWTETEPMTPSNVTLTNLVSAKTPSANTSQLSMTEQESNRHRETQKVKPIISYFSVGKTFGDHRLRLLRWCQEKTKKYGVPMYEFSESWRSGRALVAIIYSYRRDLIEDRFNPNRLVKESPRDILICGANAAKALGLNSEVDIVRVCQQKVPDFCKVFDFVRELHRCLEQKLY